MIKAQIILKDDGGDIAKLFESEKDFDNNRASYSLLRKGKGIVFDIEAKDSIALRAVLNSITKLLTVFEKAKDIEND